jgi:hypothetical protein
MKISVLPELCNDLSQFAVRFCRLLVFPGVGNRFRISQQTIEVFVTSFGRTKPFDEQVGERHSYTVNASSSARIAISSCVSSGSFVVIF